MCMAPSQTWCMRIFREKADCLQEGLSARACAACRKKRQKATCGGMEGRCVTVPVSVFP